MIRRLCLLNLRVADVFGTIAKEKKKFPHHDPVERVVHHCDQHVQSYNDCTNHMGNNKKVAKGGGEGKSGILNRDFVFFHETKQQPEHFEEGFCVSENK